MFGFLLYPPVFVALVAITVSSFVRRFFAVPPELKHLPRVPVWPMLWSFVSGEIEQDRIRRLLLPFSNEHGEGVVAVWAMGEWMVHVLDYKLAKQMMENRSFAKQQPREDMMFWRFVGRANVFFTEGETWKRHSRIVKAGLQQTVPIEKFALLARKLFAHMGAGGRVRWNEYTHRYTLDAVGTTVIGYDFEALDNPHGPFVAEYHHVMAEIASPAYVALPALERLVPRRALARRVDALVDRFLEIIQEKRNDRGNDVITYMLEEPGMTELEYRDNIVVLFMGGHDTTAGALSTLIYFLAKYPEHQRRAREEVLTVLGTREPSLDDFTRLPYLQACVRESMRMNNPSTITVPRLSPEVVHLGRYTIPPHVPVLLNMYAIMHSSRDWGDEGVFRPERFLGAEGVGDDGQWMPFGAGPRQCPARMFAMYEQRTLAVMLLQEYEWTLPVDSIHRDAIKNSFSAFALSLPYDMDIDFRKLR